jgi:hypothetical protein
MQTVEYLGQTVEFPEGMSEDEMRNALQNDKSLNPDIEGDVGEYEEGFYQGKFKTGVGTGWSFFKTIGQNPVWSKVWEDMTTVGGTGELNKPGVTTELKEQFSTDFRKNQEDQVNFLTNLFHWEKPDLDLLPEDQKQAILGVGAEMSTDPLILVSKAKSLTEFGIKAAINAARWGGIGVGSTTAAVTAGGFEEAITGEDTGVASTTVGLGTALITGFKTQKLVDRLATGATNMLKGTSVADFKSTISTYEQRFALANTRNVLKEISKAEGMDVEKVVADFRQISHYFNDVDIPFFLSLSDNPVVVGELNKLIRKDPQVRAQVYRELEKIENAIKFKSNTLFGVPIVGKELQEIIPQDVINQSLRSHTDIIKQRIETINSKLEDLSSSYIPELTKAELGLKIENLVRAKKKEAQALRTIEYETILKNAKKDKVFMPKEGVAQIWNYVKSVRLDNKFGQGTTIQSKINTLLKPKIKVTKEKGADGKTITKREQIFPKLNFAGVDSLKREINKQLRRNLSPDVRFQLEELKTVLGEARTTIPGPYSAALDVADMNYYKHIGIPFTEQGIKEISSAKYAQRIAPVVVQNSESLTQFLNVVGEAKGMDIAKNAFLAEVWQKAVVNNALVPARVKKIMKDKSEVIDMIPGLKEELTQTLKTEGYLSSRVNNLNKEFKIQEKKIGDHFLSAKYGGVEGFQPSKIVDDMISSRETLIKITNDIKMLPVEMRSAVENTLRRQFLDNISLRRNSLEWLTNPENTYTVQRIMGKGYQNDVRAFARLTDRINRVAVEEVGNLPMNPLYDVVEKKTGIPLPAVVAMIRRPIISNKQKIVLLSSRMWSGKRGGRADRQMQKILLSDLNALDEFYKLEKLSKKTNISNDTLIQKFTDIVVGSVPAYFAVKGEEVREQSQHDLDEQMEEYEAAVFAY